MNYSFFINRPVLASVISIVIVLVGVLCMKSLPVAQYPDLLPPTVSVSAQYPGASAETLAQTVGVPLETQINGVEDMIYMNSVANAQGTLSITVTFALGTDPDQATINVNNRVQRALTKLPSAVQRLGVTVDKRSTSILGVIAMRSTSELYDRTYVGNYALLNVVDDLKRVPGVGDAQVVGNMDYAMRIWMRPDKLAQYKLTPTDVINAVNEQNAQYAVGRFGEEPDKVLGAYTYSATTQGRLVDTEQFGNIILTSDENGAALKLKDVARIELGSQFYMVDSDLNGETMVPIMIFLQPGANALATMDAIKTRLSELEPMFPAGIDYVVPYDTTTFIQASVEEVIYTFIEAILLVIFVVFIFLQNWRATLIPVIAVPISILGTFGGMYIFGFSINMLTLFGMVLAIGIVVDDAIVVLENVERLMEEENLSPHDAAVKSMAEVTAPVIAIVLVLCAVFVPVSFMGGMTGVMYQQFAITIAISVVLSGLVALTLTPALCSLLLKPRKNEKLWGPFEWFNNFFNKITDYYVKGVTFFVHNAAIGVTIFALFCISAFGLFKVVPTSLLPDEDQGVMLVFVSLPPAASLERTRIVMKQVEDVLLKNPAVENATAITGYDMMSGGLKTSAGTMFLTLKDWSARKGKPLENPLNMTGPLIGATSGILGGFALPVNPPAIMGLSTGGGIDLYLQDRTGGSIQQLSDYTQALLAEAKKDPVFVQVQDRVTTTFNPNVPQINVEVDREKARAMAVPISTIYDAMSSAFGGVYINDFTLYGRNYQVKLQSEGDFRRTPDDLKQVYVRSDNGDMVPLDAVTSYTRQVGSDQLERFNAFYATHITANPGPGYTTGDAIKAMSAAATKVLPEGYVIQWSGSSYQEVSNSGAGNTALIFGVIMVFLILAAQYEKWTLPFAVIMAVPFAVVGALLFTQLRGLTNDVYFQIGLVTLIGLASKNAILIVEFAVLEREAGKSAIEAAISAARLRFRPIVMTSLAFILGIVPLAKASGAGAASRHSIGTGVIGGMLFATCIATFFIPMFYSLFTKNSKSGRGSDGPVAATASASASPAETKPVAEPSSATKSSKTTPKK